MVGVDDRERCDGRIDRRFLRRETGSVDLLRASVMSAAA